MAYLCRNIFLKLAMAFRILGFVLLSVSLYSQKAVIRGHVFDKQSGEPLAFANIVLQGTNHYTSTDATGFYTLSGLEKGEYTLIASYVGYDSQKVVINLKPGQIVNKQLLLEESAIQLGEVSVSGSKEKARTEVKVSMLTVTPKEIKALPSTGGEPDIAQYLQIIPGVISTGDQGGQIFIRGGSPIQNKILLDGMTIINPFHSIGIFSVFETEVIRTVDVITGGFPAEYGGRVSAIVDLKTREGNKTRYSGLISGGPFMAKALLEGPISKFKESKGGSTSFLVTGKTSYIDRTSRRLYKYALDSNQSNLPFSFADIYGKISTLSNNGSSLHMFGFNFDDRVRYPGLADLRWSATGAGTNFTIVPNSSNLLVGGTLAYSRYNIGLDEVNSDPKSSEIKGIQANMDFTYFTKNSEVKYGVEFNAFSTDFKFINFQKRTIESKVNNTEIAAFLKYKYLLGRWVFDPSFRIQYFASLLKTRYEPRFGLKYNWSQSFRLKAAGGYYNQNLTSSVNERDIVNLFVGFLTSPDLISSWHGVLGFEIDLFENTDLNVEAYAKDFNNIYSLNRNKRLESDGDFMVETGDAYGIDVLLRTALPNWSFWMTYSYGFVNRNDGKVRYPALFDRRHNSNLVIDYHFGARKAWQAGLRWNLGSGFAFTKIQGFFEENKLPHGIDTDFRIENSPIGVIYSTTINSGRLPYYHRLDVSIRKRFFIAKLVYFDVTASVTNAYNRKNIFYFNVLENRRINQLPILPSLVASFHF